MPGRLGSLTVLLIGLLFSSASPAADRARQALDRRGLELRRLLADKGLPFPPREVFIRAFKRERVLEIWARERRAVFQHVLSVPFCAASGGLGPKRRSGDGQVPEGFYHLDRFNPWSAFHLSLGLDYPNRADRLREAARQLGGDIFLHGGCASIGCIAVTDAGIEPLYLLAAGSHRRGQQRIPVHIFPTRLDDRGLAWLRSRHAGRPALLAFWESLRPAYLHFERTRSLPQVQVDARGNYRLRKPAFAAR